MHPSLALYLHNHIFIVRYVGQDDTNLIMIFLTYRRRFGQKDAACLGVSIILVSFSNNVVYLTS